MTENKKIIIPSAFFQIGDFVSIDNNSKVSLSESTSHPLIMCKDLSGKLIFIRFKLFKSNDNLSTTSLKEFFKLKQSSMVNDKEILKIKNFLEDDEDIEAKIEELSLSRKEERVWLKNKAGEMALNNWEISKGKWMRAAINSTSELVSYNNSNYYIYESHSIFYDDPDGRIPSKSGLYYVTKNRHSIPLISLNTDTNKSVFLNKNVASIDNLISLINHSIRTAEMKIDFLPEFSTRDESWLSFCSGMNLYKSEKKYSRYIDGCKYLLENIDSDTLDNIFIKLPQSLSKSFRSDLLQSDSNSMINTLKNGIQRIHFGGIQESKIDEFSNDFYSEFVDPGTIYGFYDIVSISDEIEGNTYGFLTNNLNPRKTYFDIDTLSKSILNLTKNTYA